MTVKERLVQYLKKEGIGQNRFERLGIPVDIIGKLLGHSDSLHSTTLIYVHFDEAQMDAANRKIIDYISRI